MIQVTCSTEGNFPPGSDPGQRMACAFPVACQLTDQTLLIGYRRGATKHSRDGSFEVRSSNDRGQSWSQPIKVSSDAEIPLSVHAGAVFGLPDGTAGAIWTAVTKDDPESYIFSESGRRHRQRVFLATSGDSGQTWSDAREQDIPDLPALAYCNSRPLACSDGTVLVPFEVTTQVGSQSVGIAPLDPTHQSCQQFQLIADDPSGAISYGDPKFVELPDGSLAVFLWVFETKSEQTLETHICWSSDRGQTWSLPSPSPLTCQIPVPMALPDGRLIVVGNVRTPPEGIRLWVSTDSARSWSATPTQLWDARSESLRLQLVSEKSTCENESTPIWEALPGFTFGTPDLVWLGDDEFLFTHYAVLDNLCQIKAWRLAIQSIP